MYNMYMDTYRQTWYNIGILEEVPLSAAPPERRNAVEEKRVSAAQRKATDKYLEKFDEIRIRIPKGQKDTVKAHAEARGESVNGFIGRAISETIQRDNGDFGASREETSREETGHV